MGYFFLGYKGFVLGMGTYWDVVKEGACRKGVEGGGFHECG
jgi:hypothetical protein